MMKSHSDKPMNEDSADWKLKPVPFVRDLPKGIDYAVFIDECGHNSMKPVDEFLRGVRDLNQDESHLVVMACVLSRRSILDITSYVVAVKKIYWPPDGFFLYKGKLKKVCFHSRKIRRRDMAFSEDVIPYDRFTDDLNTIIEMLDAKLFCACVDKLEFRGRHSRAQRPYDMCVDTIFDGITNKLLAQGQKCLVIVEAQQRPDIELHSHIVSWFNSKPAEIQSKIAGVYFNEKWTKDGNKTYFGLEFADLLCYPVYRFFKDKERVRGIETVEKKLFGYPDFVGNGLLFPK